MLENLKSLIHVLLKSSPPVDPVPKEFESVLSSVEAREEYRLRWAEDSGKRPDATVSIPYSVALDLLKADEALSLAVNALKEISGNPIRRDNKFPGHRDLDIARSALVKVREIVPIGGLIDDTAKRLLDTPRKKAAKKL